MSEPVLEVERISERALTTSSGNSGVLGYVVLDFLLLSDPSLLICHLTGVAVEVAELGDIFSNANWSSEVLLAYLDLGHSNISLPSTTYLASVELPNFMSLSRTTVTGTRPDFRSKTSI